MGTPPREISALSPGSESQSLRRKAVLEELPEERVKRARFKYESGDTSPIAARQQSRPFEGQGDIQPDITDTLTAPGPNSYSEVDPPLEENDSTDSEVEENPNARWDPGDGIFRCGSCGYELWDFRGECSTCHPEGKSGYFEVVDPNLGLVPGIVRGQSDTDGSSIDSEEKIELVGDCLDFDSSAYDSQDERDEHNDEYEIDSFIDDESIRDSEEEDDSLSDDEDEIDYKQKFLELRTDYFNLVDEYGETVEEYEEFKQIVMGSDYEGYDSDELEMNEEGIVIVDVPPPDPVLAEVILSQSMQESQSQDLGDSDSLADELAQATTEGESQKSELLTEGENSRAEVYELALDGRWHDVSLVSTSANHSYEDVEL